MLGLDKDHDALRSELFHEGVGYLRGHALLELEALGVDLDGAGYLAQAYDLALRDVATAAVP